MHVILQYLDIQKQGFHWNSVAEFWLKLSLDMYSLFSMTIEGIDYGEFDPFLWQRQSIEKIVENPSPEVKFIDIRQPQFRKKQERLISEFQMLLFR